MFGSNQPLPETLSLQLLTCLYLPPKLPGATLTKPQMPFFTHSHDKVYGLVLLFVPLTALTSCHVSYMHLTLALTPCSGLTLGLARSEHCGVLSTAWSNVDEAWGRSVGCFSPRQLSDVCWSAQRFSTFNLQVLTFTLCSCVCSH